MDILRFGWPFVLLLVSHVWILVLPCFSFIATAGSCEDWLYLVRFRGAG
uniref:Uncharacterized protein n=1 Tax=Arundo donax TaxID=35708 RepID=A0A0A8Z3F0_ARUDO